MIRHLFAYGTLLEGTLDPTVEALVRHACRRRGPACVGGRLYDLGGYPGALPEPGGQVYGEVLEMLQPQQCVPVFDVYEDYDPADPRGSLYRRETVRVALSDGPVECWVYWLNQLPARAPVIPSGRWFGAAP